MRSLKNKTALITGGARRLGRTCALQLADRGTDIVLHYRNSKKEAEETAQEIRSRGVRCRLAPLDLGQTGYLDQYIAELIQENPVDILINSASIFPEDTIAELTPESFSQNMDINALAPFLLGRAIAGQPRETDIINLLDTRIVDSDTNHASYHLSKRTFFTMTRIMSEEWAPRTRVNAVAPGLVMPPEGQDQSYMEKRKHKLPMECYGAPEDVTHAILFLLESRFITGQIIFVDGGRHLRGSRYGV